MSRACVSFYYPQQVISLILRIVNFVVNEYFMKRSLPTSHNTICWSVDAGSGH